MPVSNAVGAHRKSYPVVPPWVPLAGVAALFVVPLLIFAGLAESVARNESFAFDRSIMMWVHGATTPWLTSAMTAVSHAGGIAVSAVAVVIALLLCVWRRWRDAVLVVVAENGASQINDALKSVFERPRPDFWAHLSVENTHSFPSGHAMASMSIAAALFVVAWRTRYRWAVLVAAAVYVVAVGTSRVYLGVHFPSDVLAGWCLTVVWVGLVVVILQGLARWHRRRALRRALPDAALPDAAPSDGAPSEDVLPDGAPPDDELTTTTR